MNLLIIGFIVFVALGIVLKSISWVCTGISDWLWMRKVKKENKAVQARRDALDEEAKRVCGDNWMDQMQYKVKKSLYTLREIRAKDHPEEFYRDKHGLLQEKNKPKKENKIELKTKGFKCPSCGAPIGTINDEMRGSCNYCGTQVAFVNN
jgi:hypothetical protein